LEHKIEEFGDEMRRVAVALGSSDKLRGISEFQKSALMQKYMGPAISELLTEYQVESAKLQRIATTLGNFGIE
jgi:hypothetical protein